MSEGKKVESRRKDRTAIKVGGEWYPCTKEVGEYVNNNDIVTVEEAGPETNERDGKKVIKKVKVVERGYQPGSSGGAGGSGGNKGGNDADRQGSIIRQSCMGYAATVVAATLTGKSNPEDAAKQVIKIADEMLVPYASEGKKPGETSKPNEASQPEPSQAPSQEASEPEASGPSDDEDDDIPF